MIEKTTYPAFYNVTMSPNPEDLEPKSREMLGEWMTEVEGTEVPFGVQVAVGRPATEICNFAQQHGSDLVVIATHGLTGFQRVAMGGTAEQVIRLCQCPVLVVRSVGTSAVT